LDLRASDDDLKSIPLAFLDLLVLWIARDDVELGAAQEQVVVTLRSRLEVELEVDILAEFPGGLDVQVPLDGRVVNQLALDHLESAVVGFGLAIERLLLSTRFSPSVKVLAVEQQREALFELELVSREARPRHGHQQASERQQAGPSSHGSTSPKEIVKSGIRSHGRQGHCKKRASAVLCPGLDDNPGVERVMPSAHCDGLPLQRQGVPSPSACRARRPSSARTSSVERRRANLRCQIAKQAAWSSGQRVATPLVTAVTR